MPGLGFVHLGLGSAQARAQRLQLRATLFGQGNPLLGTGGDGRTGGKALGIQIGQLHQLRHRHPQQQGQTPPRQIQCLLGLQHLRMGQIHAGLGLIHIGAHAHPGGKTLLRRLQLRRKRRLLRTGQIQLHLPQQRIKVGLGDPLQQVIFIDIEHRIGILHLCPGLFYLRQYGGAIKGLAQLQRSIIAIVITLRDRTLPQHIGRLRLQVVAVLARAQTQAGPPLGQRLGQAFLRCLGCSALGQNRRIVLQGRLVGGFKIQRPSRICMKSRQNQGG